MLARLLEDCGFESVVQSQFRSSRLPELAIDDASRMYVEALIP
jgi:hypothetical protein